MIVLLNRSGQTCNQLFSIATTLSRANEENCKAICPIVDKNLMSSFSFLCDEKVIIKSNDLLFAISKLIVIFKSINFFNTKIITRWIESVEIETAKRNKDYVLNHILYKDEDIKKAQYFFERYELNPKKTIAVHIRRGDYKEFEGGKYYYSDSDYIKWIADMYKQDKNISFILFSNEKIIIDHYSEYPCFITDSEVTVDLLIMSMCRQIIGPPSTFSLWANYTGDNILTVLSNKDQIVKIG